MASNLSSIGFVFADETQFRDTMTRLAGEARDRLKCPAGEYAIWRSRTGAEIWFQLDSTIDGGAAGEAAGAAIVGLAPFFEGTGDVRLAITEIVNRPDDTALEGLLHAAPGSAENGGATSYPLVFDAVDFAAHADRALPATWRCRLAGFCRELDVFETPDDMMRSGEFALAEQAAIPIGLFQDEDAPDAGPQPYLMLTGHILEHRLLANEITGANFHALRVETLDTTIDLVADPEIVGGELRVGAIVQAVVWLFGRVLD